MDKTSMKRTYGKTSFSMPVISEKNLVSINGVSAKMNKRQTASWQKQIKKIVESSDYQLAQSS